MNWLAFGAWAAVTGSLGCTGSSVESLVGTHGAIHVIAPLSQEITVFLDGRRVGVVSSERHGGFAVLPGPHLVQYMLSRGAQRPEFHVDIPDPEFAGVFPVRDTQCFALHSTSDAEPLEVSTPGEPLKVPRENVYFADDETVRDGWVVQAVPCE